MFVPIFRKVFACCLILFLFGCKAASTPNSYQPRFYGEGSGAAVWNLEDLSVMGGDGAAGMNEFLTDRVTEIIAQKSGFVIIEREKLVQALEELSLGSSQLVDESSRLKLGRILGAQLMVFGAYQIVGEQIRIDLRLVEVESGLILATSEKTTRSADVAGWLDAAGEAAAELLAEGGK